MLAVCLSANGEYDKVADELRRDYPGLTAEFAGWFPYASAASAEPIKEGYNARAGIDLLRQLLAPN